MPWHTTRAVVPSFFVATRLSWRFWIMGQPAGFHSSSTDFSFRSTRRATDSNRRPTICAPWICRASLACAAWVQYATCRPTKTNGTPHPAQAERTASLAAKRRQSGSRRRKSSRRRSEVKLRRVSHTETWELVHPRCVRQRAEDLEEVRSMIDAGEVEIAVERAAVPARRLRGLRPKPTTCLASRLSPQTISSSRGPISVYAYDIARAALPAGGVRGTLPYHLAPNQHFFQAAKGLVGCLRQLGREDQAARVAHQMLALDPADALGFAAFAAQLGDTDNDAT